MAGSKRTLLKKSMAGVWANMPPGTTAEQLLRPVSTPNTSGPTTPLPGRHSIASETDSPTSPLPGTGTCASARSTKDKP